MEPVGAFHDCIEVKFAGVSLGDSRVGAVIDYLRGAHRCSCLAVIDTYAVTATCDIFSVHSITAKCVYRSLTDFVLGKSAYKASFVTVVSAADSYVSLATAPDYIKVVNLYETVVSSR